MLVAWLFLRVFVFLYFHIFRKGIRRWFGRTEGSDPKTVKRGFALRGDHRNGEGDHLFESIQINALLL